MSKNQNTQFTIGQFAALHGINKKTLMWYDEIGLFKPAAIKKNGYRYYTYYQSSVLETILMLRELNVSIGEIREFMELRSPSRLKELLEEKIKEVDKTVNHLKQLRKTLTARKEEMSFLLSLDLSDITVVEKEKRYIAVWIFRRECLLKRKLRWSLRRPENTSCQGCMTRNTAP